MTGHEIQKTICGTGRSFTLATAEIKARIGHPERIRILPRWCKKTGRDVLVLTYKSDDGEVQVLGTVGFLNGEETILDGWVVIIDRSKEAVEIYGRDSSISVQQNLFQDWAIVQADDPSDTHGRPAEDMGEVQGTPRHDPGVAKGEPSLFDALGE